MEHWHTPATDRLINTILKLESTDECYGFLEDICTIKEIRDMAQRLDVAVLLSRKKNYQEISRITGVSTATISRVSRCLNYGSNGYKNAINKMDDTEVYDEH